MNIKNIEIINIFKVLQHASLELKDMSLRWSLANYCKPIIDNIDIIEFEIKKLIETEGIELEDGTKQLNPNNQNYIDLMNCMSDLAVNKLSLLDIEELNITEIIDLLSLNPIVDSSSTVRVLK